MGNELVGVLEAIYLGDGFYEMAIVIKDNYQGKGIGTRLAKYAVDDIRRSASMLIAHTTPDNYKIRASTYKAL
ncbi:hypothetical protein VMUT_1145 [Vulcanisaeta moutnovskia 768-28]|uniref:N-acetyltransferase domain-containing protein n=1 Tax=Vulcanisaeta moutnovskia (strain 768-28) TaxID=985053 RepID=F0QYB3_VULM7|nr:GNAT family N-acetyltransferase [Vulcanisaeta moutnovskia]ADY01350.1 hypothetical protein VMUT_1145 [Vulcanisaeta moutnovskia 768-28]